MSSSQLALRVIAFESLELRRLLATDLLSDAVGLTATTSIEVDDTSYFFADDGVHGQELWKSDDTAAGTALVKDLTPGAGGSELVAFYECRDRLVFVTVVELPPTNHVRRDYTVWSSDGTEAGTVKLLEFKDVMMVQLRQVGERVALVATRISDVGTDLSDALLYFTDGTAAGTDLVREFRAELGDESAGTSDMPYATLRMFVAGERVVFDLSETFIWASDGTAAGTMDLTEALEPSGFISAGAMMEMFEYDGKVWLPRAGKLSSTDGTIAGTAIRSFAITGGFEGNQSKLSGDTFYFVNVANDSNGEQYKALRAYHIPTGTLTEVYRPTEMHGESYFLTLHKIGDHLFMSIINHTRQTGSLWGVNGTSVEKFTDLGGDRSFIYSPVSVQGVAYFVLTDGTATENDANSPAPVGWIGSAVGKSIVLGGEPASVKLWRSDGTKAGTGVVRTLWEGDPAGKEVRGSLTTGTGVLLVRTQISEGVTPGNDENLTTVWDDTLAYRPEELNLARDFATARVVNGVLRLNGSMQPDTFRLHRPEGDPSLLVVEVNGVARSFAFNSIRRIIADLQDGNDTLDVVEAPGREIRLWTSVLGGDGADTILTATGRDTIIGGSGPDMIRSRGNADLVIGGGGRDRITSGQGDDVILGGTGNDAIITNSGQDVLFGQSAVESAFGQLWEDGDEEEDLVLPGLS